MFNEIKHISLPLAQYANDGTIPEGLDNVDYLKNQLKTSSSVWALVSCNDENPKWECGSMPIVNFEQSYGYKVGPIYEAEIGKRTLKGKPISAIEYLAYYEHLCAKKPVSNESCTVFVNCVCDDQRLMKFVNAIENYGISENDYKIIKMDEGVNQIEIKLNKGINFYLALCVSYQHWTPRIEVSESTRTTRANEISVFGISMSLF